MESKSADWRKDSLGKNSALSSSNRNDRIFIDGAFNMSYAEKLYGHSPEAIAWREKGREERRQIKKDSHN